MTGVTAGYGPTVALIDVDVRVGAGEFVTILGANGAGKSSMFKVISGLLRPTSGTVDVVGRRINGWQPHRIARLGVGQVPEGRQVFADLTVDEHLRLAGQYGGSSSHAKSNRQFVLDMFPILAERHRQLAGTLSGGQQQMLVIGRALMLSPQLLLLDEPSLGLAPLIVDQILTSVRVLADRGTAVLLIEQNAAQALRHADRGYVLGRGRILQAGPAEQLLAGGTLMDDYLGGGAPSMT